MKIKFIILFCIILTLINFSIIFSAFQRPKEQILGETTDPNIQENMTLITSDYSTITSKNSAIISIKDYRSLVLDKYFARYNSPLQGYGNDFVQACKKYRLPSDCTLIPAIAYVETGLCTKGISDRQFNCWGWGGSNENRIWFRSYSFAIDNISMNMSSRYGNWLSDPERMQYTYCGEHCHNWGQAVRNAQREINSIARNNGFPSLF